MIASSILIKKGPGPTGTVVMESDDTGLKDVSSRYMTFWNHVGWPITATMAASYIWTCYNGLWQVEDVEAVMSVTGGASATMDVLVCAGLTAPGSGTSQLTAVLDIQETAPFRARGTLIASPTILVRGDSIAANMGGTMTGAVGVLNVRIKRVG